MLSKVHAWTRSCPISPTRILSQQGVDADDDGIVGGHQCCELVVEHAQITLFVQIADESRRKRGGIKVPVAPIVLKIGGIMLGGSMMPRIEKDRNSQRAGMMKPNRGNVERDIGRHIAVVEQHRREVAC